VRPVTAELWAEADQPSFDLSVVLSMVEPDGRVWNLTQGHRPASASGRVGVGLRATCATVPAGHALRVSVAGACFPAYPVNPGTGGMPHETRAEDERVITLRIAHGGATASHVSLPAVA
jgi:putative CocE/NonD family hydrolase